MMSRQSSGLVLLTTLTMIAILVMLTLSLMQGVILYLKASHQLVVRHRSFYQMESVFKRLDLTNQACVIKNKTANQLVDLVIAGQGCTMIEGAQTYVYLVDDLGLYPCLQLTLNSVINGSHHWLITFADDESPKHVIQVRMAKYAETIPCDGVESRRINQGVISWRRM